MKIVINICYGGFSVSDAALRRYAERKGLTLYPETENEFTTYWIVPPDQRTGILSDEDFWKASSEEHMASNAAFAAATLSNGLRDIDRTDPDLVAVVEELGGAANGAFAKLKIEDIPAGSCYRIREYDGFESIEFPHELEWERAK